MGAALACRYPRYLRNRIFLECSWVKAKLGSTMHIWRITENVTYEPFGNWHQYPLNVIFQ